MMPARIRNSGKQVRVSPRVHSVQDISLTYEGHSEELLVRPPDLSRRGMFISTTRIFPEGAVLNLKFRLAVTGLEVRTRCEVRHCLSGVGVGVEFVGLSSIAADQIEQEIKLCEQRPVRKRSMKRSAKKNATALRVTRKRKTQR
jgi:PilZ domain